MKRFQVFCLAFVAGFFLVGTLHAQPVQQKLVAYWSFDSAVGNTFYDVTGHGYDASWTGTGVSRAPGVVGQALRCTGTGYELTVANSRDSFALAAVTVEAWYNTDTAMSAYILDYQWVASGVYNGWGLYIRDDGLLELGASNNGRYAWLAAVSTTPINPGRWYHVAGSYDGSSFKVYVNGNLEGTAPYVGGIGYPVAANARIACQTLQSGLVRLFDRGRIDELKLYNYALSADSIKAHYTAGKPPVMVLIPCVPDPTYNRRPVFKWHSSPKVSVYRLQVDTVSLFRNPIISIPLSDTFYLPQADLPIRTLYWRVSSDADTLTWSAMSSVTILDASTPILIPYTPDPTLDRRPTLMWHAVSGTTSYAIQIAGVAGFASPILSDVASDTLYRPLAPLPIGPVYWRVKSTSGTLYSLIDTFTIQSDSVPILIAIFPDSQTNKRPVFSWHPGVGATTYRIQVDTVGNFVDPFISLPVTDTFYLPQANLPPGKIFWRVSANFNFLRYSSVDTFLEVPGSQIAQGIESNAARGVRLVSNPAGRGFTVGYRMDSPAGVRFSLFSLAGRRVAVLYEGRSEQGEHSFTFGNAGAGMTLPKGGYVLQCQLGETVITKKLLITR
jgi:Concanavalin A-like lectin/glucanases superfamily